MILEDIIYGKVELKGIYEKIATCDEFIRLKDITQTAMSTLEYKELEKGTRYDHSIGVYYLMCRTLNVLEKKLSAEGLFISKEEKELAKLAALLHDIGHGVNSHLLEHITGISHEQRGIDIIKDPTTKIHQIIVEHYGEAFIAKLVEFMECIYGNVIISEGIELHEDHTVPLRLLLAALISHNIDLDRLDYLMRDATYAGFRRLTNYQELIQSFDCVLVGNQMSLAIPREKMHLIETNILERTRNYQEIYYHDIDFLGNHSFEQLLLELRSHPEEVPDSVPKAIKKYLTQEKANLTTQEYMSLTNEPMNKAIEQIKQNTKSEKIRYLCNYKENAKKDYQILYNGRSEAYIRKLLAKVIPNFNGESNSLFSETRVIKPYKKSKFGSTNITTKVGVQRFEDLPHAVSIEPISKTVMAINPELLRLELGIPKQEFEEKYADMIQEIIQNQAKPTQEFELKYRIPKDTILYTDVLKLLDTKYERQDWATYQSKDTYYDSLKDFHLLDSMAALRTREGVTYHNQKRSRGYKNKRITYKTYVEDGETSYTIRNKLEEIGDTTKLQDYAEFLQEIGENEDLSTVLEIKNMRKLVTILVNGNPIDISFNIAEYQNNIYHATRKYKLH